MSNLRTAAEYRTLAAQARQQAADSFANSDTDGFLSQWASGQMAARYDALAKAAENGGTIDALALFLDGEVASLDQRDGEWGFYWILNDAAAAKFGKRFFNPSKAKNATERDRAKGFTYGTVRVAVLEDPKSSKIIEDRDAIKRGEYEVIATDGAYANIDAQLAG